MLYFQVSKRKELHVHQNKGQVIHLGLLLTFVLEMCNKVQSLFPKMEILSMMEAAFEEMKQKTVSLSRDVKTLSLKFVSVLKTMSGLEKKVSDLEARVEKGRNDPRVTPEGKRMETKVSDLTKNMEKMAEKIRLVIYLFKHNARYYFSVNDTLFFGKDRIQASFINMLANFKWLDFFKNNNTGAVSLGNTWEHLKVA